MFRDDNDTIPYESVEQENAVTKQFRSMVRIVKLRECTTSGNTTFYGN